MAATKHSQGLYRIDSPQNGTYAWIVVLTRNRESFRKHFTDNVHGGRDAALAAATAYRDQILKKHPPLKRSEYVSVLRKNNTSGHAGVRLNRNKDGEPLYWAASWVPASGGTSKVVKFSVAKYGFERAKELAVAARKSGVSAIDDFYKPLRGETVNPPAVRRARVRAPTEKKTIGLTIRRAYLTRSHVVLRLSDGCVIHAPFDWYPVLAEASSPKRAAWRLSEDADVIRWDQLGLTINPAQLIRRPKP